jgi:hypothetical protein
MQQRKLAGASGSDERGLTSARAARTAGGSSTLAAQPIRLDNRANEEHARSSAV